MVSCSCGHRAYAGYLDEAVYLSARLHWLDERIAAGDPAPDAVTARRFGIWPAPSAPAPTGPGEPAVRHPDHAVQTLLLGLGAGLLIVAGVVFTAVVWNRLGAAGQVSVMALATFGFGAVAARLVRRLPGTAEALAVVAFGLATVDAVAAPALGLVPDTWLDTNRAYPAAVALAGAAAAVGLGHVLTLRAWVRLGWPTAGVGAALVTWYLARGVAHSSQPWAAVSVSVVALAAVGLLAGPHLSARLRVDLRPMTVAGAVALVLAVPTWINWVSDLGRTAILGTIATTLATAAAAVLVWVRTHLSVAGVGAAVLVAITGGLALLLPRDEQASWLAAVVAGTGVALLGALARAGHLQVGLLASAVLWTTWTVGRLVIGDSGATGDHVASQLWVLAALVAVTWFVVAALGHAPTMAWPAAGAGEAALLVARPDLPDLPESWTLPFAALLLSAGYLWQRSASDGSLTWLGPGATMALLPSAFACWAAPWVVGSAGQTSNEALTRLVTVLVVGVTVVTVGAHLRLSGLLLPSAVALGVAGAAQLYGTLAAMPRWLALGLAGAALVIVGARLEWLRGRGLQVRTFVGSLH